MSSAVSVWMGDRWRKPLSVVTSLPHTFIIISVLSVIRMNKLRLDVVFSNQFSNQYFIQTSVIINNIQPLCRDDFASSVTRFFFPSQNSIMMVLKIFQKRNVFNNKS